MKKNNFMKGWAGCSDFNERREELTKAHAEFVQSELKKKLDEGYKVKARVKRPRIQKEMTPRMIITSVLGELTKVSFEIYKDKYEPLGFKIITKIY